MGKNKNGKGRGAPSMETGKRKREHMMNLYLRKY